MFLGIHAFYEQTACIRKCYCPLTHRPCACLVASGPTLRTMEFPWHSVEVLEQLNRQRNQGLLCDCTFVVDGVDFKAHKSVLAACSMYFRTLFLDQKDVVHLDISNAAGRFHFGSGLAVF